MIFCKKKKKYVHQIEILIINIISKYSSYWKITKKNLGTQENQTRIFFFVSPTDLKVVSIDKTK